MTLDETMFRAFIEMAKMHYGYTDEQAAKMSDTERTDLDKVVGTATAVTRDVVIAELNRVENNVMVDSVTGEYIDGRIEAWSSGAGTMTVRDE